MENGNPRISESYSDEIIVPKKELYDFKYKKNNSFTIYNLKLPDEVILLKLLHEKYLVFSNDFIKYISKKEYPIDILIYKLLTKKVSIKKNTYFYNKKQKIKRWYEIEKKVSVSSMKVFVSENFICKVDGFIKNENGILLIKSKYEISTSLVDFYMKYKSGVNTDLYYFDHICFADYLEIQYCLKITNAKWCDYVIFSKQNNLCYIERIYLNNKISTELFLQINQFNILLKNHKNQ